ncbi:unnamed protein product [Prorocentrum cordatum]|uniref:B30.2/SPRY domain-containing protein n=1 Tax=Prorocentrum cordatum TaxID=2364126 RepID=A0ABN9SEK9_9DINO|nr:unnamed protein product [Polarella glacialis]
MPSGPRRGHRRRVRRRFPRRPPPCQRGQSEPGARVRRCLPRSGHPGGVDLRRREVDCGWWPDGRAGDLTEAFERLGRAAQRLAGPRQRRLALERERRGLGDWPRAAEELAAAWSLDGLQAERLSACQFQGGSEGSCRSSELSESIVKTRSVRYRTRRDGQDIHIVYGLCELEWEFDMAAPGCPSLEIMWDSFGGDFSNVSPNHLVQLEKQTHHDFHTARANIGISKSVLQWEVIPHGVCSSVYVGVCTGGMPLDELVRNEVCLCLHSKGYLHRGLSGQPSLMLEPFRVGDVLGFCLDMDAGTLALCKNGVHLADAAGLDARRGPLYPYVTVDYAGEGCEIRALQPQLTADTLDELLAYTARRAEHQFSLQLRQPGGPSSAAGAGSS